MCMPQNLKYQHHHSHCLRIQHFRRRDILLADNCSVGCSVDSPYRNRRLYLNASLPSHAVCIYPICPAPTMLIHQVYHECPYVSSSKDNPWTSQPRLPSCPLSFPKPSLPCPALPCPALSCPVSHSQLRVQLLVLREVLDRARSCAHGQPGLKVSRVLDETDLGSVQRRRVLVLVSHHPVRIGV